MPEVLYPSVSRQEYQRRYDALWREMDDRGIDALVFELGMTLVLQRIPIAA